MMEMVHAHKGHFMGDVQFYTVERLPVKIPTDKPITVLWDATPTETKAKSQKQLDALDCFLAANKALDEQGIEPLDEEFFTIVNSGVGVDSGVDL